MNTNNDIVKNESDSEYSSDVDDVKEATVAEVISDTIHAANTTQQINDDEFEELYEVDTNIKGGTDIIGLVGNILEGGNMPTEPQQEHHVQFDLAQQEPTDVTLVRAEVDPELVETESSNANIKSIVSEVLETDGTDVISNIFLEENSADNSSSSHDSFEEYESDDDANDDTKYAEIIKDIRSAQSVTKSKLSLKGGSVKAPSNVRIINAYPWILKS